MTPFVTQAWRVRFPGVLPPLVILFHALEGSWRYPLSIYYATELAGPAVGSFTPLVAPLSQMTSTMPSRSCTVVSFIYIYNLVHMLYIVPILEAALMRLWLHI